MPSGPTRLCFPTPAPQRPAPSLDPTAPPGSGEPLQHLQGKGLPCSTPKAVAAGAGAGTLAANSKEKEVSLESGASALRCKLYGCLISETERNDAPHDFADQPSLRIMTRFKYFLNYS